MFIYVASQLEQKHSNTRLPESIQRVPGGPGRCVTAAIPCLFDWWPWGPAVSGTGKGINPVIRLAGGLPQDEHLRLDLKLGHFLFGPARKFNRQERTFFFHESLSLGVFRAGIYWL